MHLATGRPFSLEIFLDHLLLLEEAAGAAEPSVHGLAGHVEVSWRSVVTSDALGDDVSFGVLWAIVRAEEPYVAVSGLQGVAAKGTSRLAVPPAAARGALGGEALCHRDKSRQDQKNRTDKSHCRR